MIILALTYKHSLFIFSSHVIHSSPPAQAKDSGVSMPQEKTTHGQNT